jgi:Domain of unknown function (DUF4287)
MADQSAPWPTQGPASYFPSIESKYERSIAEWQRIIAGCGIEKHMALVTYLKSEHQMGHGHANALVGWTLAGNTAAQSELSMPRSTASSSPGNFWSTSARRRVANRR